MTKNRALAITLPQPALLDVEEALPRIEIHWPHLIANREITLDTQNMPAYLLLPEIHALLGVATHAQDHLLLSTLWHTGARVSELLALTRDSFILKGPWDSFVKLKTLKQRGRPTRASQAEKPRAVPIADEAYIEEVRRYIATVRPRRGQRLFEFTRQAVDKRIRTLTAQLPPFDIPVSAHTFRHSFACNAILHGVPLTVIRDWLGHANVSTTEIYTRVLSVETHHLIRRMAF